MARYFLKISLIFIMLVSVVACGDKPSRKKPKGQRPPKVELPVSGAKIAFIFPAGAGAMRVSLGIAAQMEKDLGAALSTRLDMAGGVSSGSLLAAALTSGSVSAENLRNQIGGLVQKVFPDTNELVNKLSNAPYRLAPHEIETIFLEMLKARPDFSSPATGGKAIETILINAALKKPTIALKAGDPAKLLTDLGTILLKMAAFSTTRAGLLKNEIDTLLGDSQLSDPQNKKLIAIASSKNKPVFFASTDLDTFLSGPNADGSTKLWKALVSSAAIPGFIEAPKDIVFHPGGVITDLEDGFFAENVRFDPTAVLYDIYTKQFSGQDLVMIFVGNGAPVDSAFRKKMRWNSNGATQTEINGKKVTLVDIAAEIVDGKNNNLFNLSGFYDSVEMAKYMDDAAKKATDSSAYKWAVEALKAAR